MKNILFAIAIVLTLGLTANAQGRDSYFSNWDNGVNDRTFGSGLDLPNGQGLVTGTEYGNDEPTPLGSGLLIFTALGAGYAIVRKKRR